MDNKLFYSFLCSTIPRKDSPIAIEGLKLVSALAHRHDIPVTWIINKDSVVKARDIINQGHIDFGDNIILLIDPTIVFRENGIVPSSKAEEAVIMRQMLPEIIISEQKSIKDSLPWIDVYVAGSEYKTQALVQLLDELGFSGLWGYRWEDSWTDNIIDKGCPWSFFYISKEHHNATSPYSNKMIAIEQSSLNLNAVYYTGNNQLFSANPQALWLSGLCKQENESYSKALLDEYRKNIEWNRFMIFIQQLDALDMEYSSYEKYNGGTIAGLAGIADKFFQEISSKEFIQPISIPDAISFYKKEFGRTEASCMIFDNILPLDIDININKKHEYPLTFFYYDSECQMVFREGQMTPIEVKNYIQPPYESSFYLEKEIPLISNFRPSRDREKLIMEFEIESSKRIPYGLAIWDDHSMFSLVSTNARAVKWIGNYLLFLKVDLDEGLNRVEITLAI